jgi:hypothetical protein
MTTRARADIENTTTTSIEGKRVEFGERTLECEIFLGLDRERNTIRSKGTNPARTTGSMMIA